MPSNLLNITCTNILRNAWGGGSSPPSGSGAEKVRESVDNK